MPKEDIFSEIVIIRDCLFWESCSKSEKEQIQIALDIHKCIFYGVNKKENNSFKNTYPLNFKKLLQPHILFYHSMFQMCGDVHIRQNQLNWSVPYKNGAEWFLTIYGETVNAVIEHIKNPYKFPKDILIHNGEKKRYVLRSFNSDLAKIIREYENPFSNNPLIPNYSFLIDCVIALSQQKGDFKSVRLKPFVKAYRELIQSIDSEEWCLVSRTNHKDDTSNITTKQLKGRGKRILK